MQAESGVGGHAELELALARLCRVRGQPRYLDLAKDGIERRAHPWDYTSETPRSHFMDHLPIREVREVTGYAVRTMFYLAGVAEVANEMGDAGLAYPGTSPSSRRPSSASGWRPMADRRCSTVASR